MRSSINTHWKRRMETAGKTDLQLKTKQTMTTEFINCMLSVMS